MTHPLTFDIRSRETPSLWPPRPKARSPLELVIEVFEEENRLLKAMVVILSNLILEITPRSGRPGTIDRQRHL